MGYAFKGYVIRPDMLESIRNDIEHGIEPGDFLSAVICNDLKEAVARADDENMANLPAFVGYFYNHAPSPCWGSSAKMDDRVDGGPRRSEGWTVNLRTACPTCERVVDVIGEPEDKVLTIRNHGDFRKPEESSPSGASRVPTCKGTAVRVPRERCQ